MRPLISDDFSGKVGASYDIVMEGGAVPATLADFQPLPHSTREGGAFRLIFVGPADPVLPQDIYKFRSGDDLFDIFIVPVGRDQAGTRYEAIFF